MFGWKFKWMDSIGTQSLNLGLYCIWDGYYIKAFSSRPVILSFRIATLSFSYERSKPRNG